MTTLRITILTLGLALVSVACGSDDGTPTTQATTTTAAPATTAAPTTTIADEVAAVNAVMSHYEAWNNGDFGGFLAAFTDELAQEQDGDFPRILMNATEQIEILEPCRVVDTNPAGDTTVECPTTRSNDFHGPGGIIENVTDTFVVNADGKISSVEGDGECCDAQFAFNRKFWQWIQGAHPDVYDEITPVDGQSLPGWQRDPADMLTAIQYVEEFVAQSDDYPINP